MSYHVRIRDNRTREESDVKIDLPWGEASAEWLTAGAMACDCARGVLWDEGEYVAEGSDPDCPQQGRFSLLYATLEDGTLVPLEEAIVLH